MKKFFPSLFFAGLMCLVCFTPAAAQTADNPTKSSYSWQITGTAGFSANPAAWVTVASDAWNQPYICYADFPGPFEVNVMTFKNNSWSQVGPAGFATGLDVTMTLDFLGTPEVAMVQYHLPLVNQASAMVFDGVNFVYWGNQWFSAGDTYHTSIAIGPDHQPYVVYQDAANSSKLSVMTYDLNSWQYVGNPAFSPGFARNPVIAFSASGIPFVAFQDWSQGGKASVMKYEGSNWSYAGNAGFSAGVMDSVSLAFDATGTPFVAFSDGADSWKATVMKLSGSQWLTVGTPGFSAGAAGWTSLVFNSQGSPVVGYQDAGNGNKATVMAFEGGQWTSVGMPGFSAGEVSWVSLASAPNGKLYLGFSDAAQGNRTTVMEYAGYVGISEPSETFMTVFPNPVSDFLNLRFSGAGKQAASLRILDASGKEVRSQSFSGNKIRLNVSDFPAGIYCVQATVSGRNFCSKFTKTL